MVTLEGMIPAVRLALLVPDSRLPRRAALAALTAAAAIASSGCDRQAVHGPPAPDRAPAATSAVDPGGPARLVVLVVIDQLPSWALERYHDALAPDGLLRRADRRGARIDRVSFGYAGTYTAPGHAAIVTGKGPRESGIAANERWDRARSSTVPWVDDGRHEVLGHPGAYASPGALRSETVGDALRRQTSGRARVVAVSLKDRAAVLMGGRRPDIAVWYDPTLPGFTTSRYYAAAAPAWLVRFRAAHPVERLLTPWTPLVPLAVRERLAGRDDGPGEGDWNGLGTTFPHDPRRSPAPAKALRVLPALNDDLLALGDAAVEHHALGDDEVPDLLALSVSTMDYAGHLFGPDSWEYLDALVRTDRALGEWVDRLARRAPISVLVTSDHGVTSMPEKTGDGSRIDAAALAADLERALVGALGPGPWVDTYEPPFVYLSRHAEETAPRRARALAAVARLLRARADVAWAGPVDAVGVDEARVGDLTGPALRTAIERSIPPGIEGDVFVVPAPGTVVIEDGPRERGTSHGSPWRADREVPVVLLGAGVTPGTRIREPLAQERVAATLAAMLGLDWTGADPLPGVSRRVGAP